jgi:hypothetical protein
MHCPCGSPTRKSSSRSRSAPVSSWISTPRIEMSSNCHEIPLALSRAHDTLSAHETTLHQPFRGRTPFPRTRILRGDLQNKCLADDRGSFGAPAGEASNSRVDRGIRVTGATSPGRSHNLPGVVIWPKANADHWRPEASFRHQRYFAIYLAYPQKRLMLSSVSASCPTPTKSYSHAASRQHDPVSTVAAGERIRAIRKHT